MPGRISLNLKKEKSWGKKKRIVNTARQAYIPQGMRGYLLEKKKTILPE